MDKENKGRGKVNFLPDEKKSLLALKEAITNLWSDLTIHLDKETLVGLQYLCVTIDEAILDKLGTKELTPDSELEGRLFIAQRYFCAIEDEYYIAEKDYEMHSDAFLYISDISLKIQNLLLNRYGDILND